MKSVLLLRAPAEEGPDRYEAAFEARGYAPISIPVLETVLEVDALRDKIARGPDAQGLSGVIMTSKRAVSAWCEAMRTTTETLQVDWRTVPFYVVGEATAAAAMQIRATFPSMAHLAPGDVRGGVEAGTGERLAAFILGEGCAGRRMLCLTGDKNRETLAALLTGGGVALDMVEVYRTTASTTLPDDLRAASVSHMNWVVFFAPSAAALVAPILRDVDTLKVAAIGPTTASFLRDTLGLRVDVVASRPTPESVCGAIAALDDVG